MIFNQCKAMCPPKGEQRVLKRCSHKATNVHLCGRHAYTLHISQSSYFASIRWVRRHGLLLTEDAIQESLLHYRGKVTP